MKCFPFAVRQSVGLVVVLLSPTVLSAAAPSVQWLFPAGGQVGTTVEVKVGGSLGTAPVEVWCDQPGFEFAVAEKGDKLSIAIPADATPGLCRLRFYNAEGASALKPFVIGTAAEARDNEPNDEPRASQSLDQLPAVVNGVLSKTGETDVFSLELKRGETLIAALLANELLGSPMDGILQVVSPLGFVLEQSNDERGLDPQIAFTAPSDGRYFVRVFALPATPNSSVRLAGGADYIYRLTLTTGPFADFGVPLSSDGRQFTARMLGWNLPTDTSEIPLEWKPGTDTVHLQPPGFANLVSVPVLELPSRIEDEPNAVDQPQSVDWPVVVTGRLERPKDIDTYRFQAKKGQKLAVRVESQPLGSPADPVLKLLDAKGDVLQQNDDLDRRQRDAELKITIPNDGEYHVQVSELYGHGGPRLVYRLTLAPQEPRFRLSVKDDAFTLKAGKPLEIPVSITREFDYSGEIEVTIEGLPQGVSAEPVRSAGKGDSSKQVKFNVKADQAAAFSGPIRIIGRTAGDPSKTETVEDLWLTVSP